MKIQRYTAASMRVALAQIRAEQGPDAVILSSKRTTDGIEVIAAVDYDDSLMPDGMRQRVAPPAAEPRPAAAPRVASLMPPPGVERRRADAGIDPPGAEARARPPADLQAPRPAAPSSATATATATAPASVASTLPATSTAPVASTAPVTSSAPATSSALVAAPTLLSSLPAAAASDAAFGEMHRELKDMRRLLESELAALTWNDRRLREPLRVRVLEELTALDIAPDIALALADLVPRFTKPETASNIPLALLVKQLPVFEDQTCVNGGVLVVVGPTGAGKTTTIAKLAARWSMRHGSEGLALVSTDGYRIGARDQLQTFARILGAPLHAANDGRELAQVLERLKSKKLILVDTAGMGPRDARLAEQLATLQLGAAGAQVLLALPAHGEGNALERIVEAFASVRPSGCVLTKVDEAASLGAALSTTMRHRLPIAYVCNGQRVPEDIHSAHTKKIWLVQSAAKLKRHAPPRHDEAYMARHFGRVHSHV